MKKFDELYAIATRKSQYDQTNTWFKGVETYLEAIGKEVDEVREEIREDRLCHLEDELGDVLWNYLNVLKALEREKGIDLRKYSKEPAPNTSSVYLRLNRDAVGMRLNSSRNKP